MEKVLNAEVRTKVGKIDARQQRNAGKIPCVLYGEGAPVHITVSEREFRKNFRSTSESTLLGLKLEGKVEQVLLKDFQDNLIKNRIEHMDFFKVTQDRVLRTHVAVRLVGAPVGVKEGGVLDLLAHTLEIECLPKDLPEAIDVDVSALNLGHTLHLGDLTPPKGVKFHGAAETSIVQVAHARSAYIEPTPAEEAPVEATPAVAEPKK